MTEQKTFWDLHQTVLEQAKTKEDIIQYPDLTKESIIAVDIETKDPLIREKGPGVYRRDGYILGVSLATDSGFSEYYNIGHYNKKEDEVKKNLDYLTSVLGTRVPKLGANILYDVDWLQNFQGIKVGGRLHDIQIAEPLIDENRRYYSLDSLAKKYLGTGKYKTEITEFCQNNNLKGDERQWLWKMPSWLVAKYAKADVLEPLAIFKKQYKILQDEELIELYDLECRLLPLLLQMRNTGVRVDTEYIERTKIDLEKKISEGEHALFKASGKEFNYNSSKQLAELFDVLGIKYDYHAPTMKMKALGKKGNPKIDKAALEAIDHDISRLILDIRKYVKTHNTFFVNSFTDNNIKGRVHCSFHPLKAETEQKKGLNGTVTGRFSSTNPNLQQIPSRDKEMAPLCRRAFIPEEGYFWACLDLSQIQYRAIAHYAVGPGSKEIREKYNKDPTTDYHKETMALTGLERKPAKILNFGTAFCMGVDLMASSFGWDIDYAYEIIKLYHEKVPFVKRTTYYVSQRAEKNGFIFSPLKRRSRLVDKDKSYRMFNRLCQMTEADVIKKAMVTAYEEGIFEILMPHLTVHDELDVSVPKTQNGVEALKRLKEIMETSIKLRVPILCSVKIGRSWSDADLKEITNMSDILGG